MRTLYRVTRSNPPSADDFKSHEALGKVMPRHATADLRRSWPAVSTTTTLELATELTDGAKLGPWAAELEVPDSVKTEDGADWPLGRHVNLFDTTPEQLTSYVVSVRRISTQQTG